MSRSIAPVPVAACVAAIGIFAASPALAGADAGPHFQHVIDPTTPSTNPMFANPRNEIWLDLTTNSAGNGVAKTTVAWQFSPDRRARSVVIHERHTSTGPTDSGVAGARLACLTVDF